METKKLPVGWIALGVILVFGLAYGGCALSFRSDCIRAENGIKAQYKQNQNNYDNMWKKFKEMAQVPEMYVEDLKKVYDGAIKARYGENGSQAAIQFITEHNPNFDSAMYVKLQSAIEAGRNGFEADQKQLIDKKRQYEDLLGSSKALFVGFWFGFPRIDLDQYDIVTSDATQDVFKNKKSEEIDLRK
ncbi:MAG TPA: hypothetical protein VJ694_01505 [Patescibacteria group bacterium]|nr:hypothetical protein [Patescibacteria group bacterium]